MIKCSHCKDCKRKISYQSIRCKSCSNRFRKGKYIYNSTQINEKHKLWKDDKVTKKPLHIWVKRRKTKVEICENCKDKPTYDLANISGEYKRDINDFEWLCRSCHMKRDGRINNLMKGCGLNLKRDSKGRFMKKNG